jgi:hypothetical protein
MPDKLVQQEFSELFIKILFPAFLTVAVGVAIEMKNDRTKVSILNAFLSFVIGVSGAYLASGFIAENYQGGKFTIIVCTVTLLTEKTVKFMMNELKVDVFLTAVAEYAYQKLKTFLK